jgi:hypothetical protein
LEKGILFLFFKRAATIPAPQLVSAYVSTYEHMLLKRLAETSCKKRYYGCIKAVLRLD